MGEEVEKSSAVSAFCAGIFSKLRERQAALPTPTSPKLETHHQKIVRVRERGMVGSRGRVFATCFVSRARSYAFVSSLPLGHLQMYAREDVRKCTQQSDIDLWATTLTCTGRHRRLPAAATTACIAPRLHRLGVHTRHGFCCSCNAQRDRQDGSPHGVLETWRFHRVLGRGQERKGAASPTTKVRE